MHSDHTNGLSSSWRKPIYCSEVTGTLLKAKLEVSSRLVRPLEIGQAHVIPLSSDGKETMTVTLIEANHCPGAVMFLFEGYFGRILYTADFKYTPSIFTSPGLEGPLSIDVLYLDNTYNDPGCTWKTTEDSLEKIEEIISPIVDDANIVIALHNLGKEELLVHIARKFQRWIVVTPNRFETLQLLELPNVFTTDEDASNIRVVSQASLNWKNLMHWNDTDRKSIVIVPTGLFKLSKKQKIYDHSNVHLVPYSCHSSYSELMEFVAKVCPRKIIPIVKGDERVSDVSNFDKYLDNTKPFSFEIPKSVKTFHNQLHLLTPRLKACGKSGSRPPRKQSSKRKIPQGVIFEADGEQSSSNTCFLEDAAERDQVVPEKKTKQPSASFAGEAFNQDHSSESNGTKLHDSVMGELKVDDPKKICEFNSNEVSVLTERSDQYNRMNTSSDSNQTLSTFQSVKENNDNYIKLSASKKTERKQFVIPVRNSLSFYEAFEKMQRELKKNST